MKYNKAVKVWLLIGLLCIIIQVVVGGITRLTESGLSITEWEPIKGAFPPFTEEGWIEEFEKYKATPQYEEINEGMDLSDFKFIYFWEFIHRQWARFMGLVFLFPFIYFLIKRKIDSPLIKRLGVVIFMALLAATFGWIMVASGLIERPWVNAYKLSFHLLIAFTVYLSLLYTYLYTIKGSFIIQTNTDLHKLFKGFLFFFWLQLFFGGIMSGMRIGVVYPTWPDMNGELIPQVLFNNSLWTVENFKYYDQNELLPAIIQFIHRMLAYIVFTYGIYLSMKMIRREEKLIKNLGYLLITMLTIQVVLGIITVINCIGEIPIFLGVLHQFGALMLLTVVYISYYVLKHSKLEVKIN
jgi:cytochrome c oxidase assembly protein subunit 15